MPNVSQFSYKMNALEECKINRVFLKIIGLWPYQQSYFARIQKIFCISILSSITLVQLFVFITTQYSTNLLFKILSLVFPTLFVIVLYCIFIIRADTMKQMIEHYRENWKMLKDKLEIGIIEEYSYIARYCTLFLSGLFSFGIIMYITLQVLPPILDIVFPLNESRCRRPIIVTEYFVNQEKYIYVILLHYILALIIAGLVFCSVSMTMLIYLLQTCALLTIASYRIENAIERNILAISSPTREYLLFQKIVHAITIHQRAIEFTKFFTSEFMTFLAILIVIGVSSLSLNLLQFLRMIRMNTNDIMEIIIVIIIIIIHLTYMFMANYAGQIVINHGIKMFKATYNGMWYAAPLHTQKLFLFIMQKVMANLSLGYGNVFIASLEGFATLANMALSYLTVIYSTTVSRK
ncbi:Odorant receptor 375 [Nylanderia fulva]|uniref:Odorant receptor n=2 Tax=Nylanderia fulva TaxID=613905 RepID=A0A6G1LRD8_9HYME|nr:Odorant receptor 375 [Nylanderia fulva]